MACRYVQFAFGFAEFTSAVYVLPDATKIWSPVLNMNTSTGMDLNGNTFWEFKDSLESNRFRRIAQAHDPRVPYADLKISRMSGPFWIF